MSTERHSLIVDENEKHLPKGFESPVKGKIIVGTGSDVSGTNSPVEDGTFIVGDSSESTGVKWLREFALRKIGNVLRFFMYDESSGDDIFNIDVDKSTGDTRIGSSPSVGGKVILISNGNDCISINGVSIENKKRTGVGKIPQEYKDLDINGVIQNSESSTENVINDFVTRFTFKKEISTNYVWENVAEIEISDTTDVYSAGYVEISIVQANDSGEYGYLRQYMNFNVLNGSPSARTEGSRTDSNYPRARLSVSGNIIYFQVRITTGTGSGAVIFGDVKIGVSSSPSSNSTATWEVRKV